MDSPERWITFGINMLLRGTFADVPSRYAPWVQRKILAELGIVVRAQRLRRRQTRLVRAGVVS